MTDGPTPLRPLDDDFGPVPPRARSNEKKPTARKPTSGSGGGSSKSIKDDIAAILIYANMMLAPVLKGDVMDDVEILALAKAIDDQAKKSPRFRAAIQRMLTAMGGTSLIGVCIMIIGRRAARHGLIAGEWDANLGMALAVSQMTQAQQMEMMEAQMAQMMAAMAQQAQEATDDTEFPSPSQPGPVPTEAPRAY